VEEDVLFMVIERFRDNDMLPVYQRLQEGGRQLPEGLKYTNSRGCRAVPGQVMNVR
jgi:hypothetical protein